ncbi:MAG: hypothetical protein LCH79_05380 [Proteobacteria bacterium]|jgi:hypothetical protein|nr:hypothetical protein [Ramlibacter sp.]MCA0212591.1 hypothetical protein [Pseudomonadota bacterium]
MNTQEVANAFTALCKAGRFDEAGQQFWADTVVSVEAMQGEGARVEGRNQGRRAPGHGRDGCLHRTGRQGDRRAVFYGS